MTELLYVLAPFAFIALFMEKNGWQLVAMFFVLAVIFFFAMGGADPNSFNWKYNQAGMIVRIISLVAQTIVIAIGGYVALSKQDTEAALTEK